MSDARFWKDRGWMHLHPLTAVLLTILTGCAATILWSALTIDMDGMTLDFFLRSMVGMGLVAFALQVLFTAPFTAFAAMFANRNSQNHTRLMWAAHYAMAFLLAWVAGWALFDDLLSPILSHKNASDDFWPWWWYPIANIVLCGVAANYEGARAKDRAGADRHVDAGLA